MPFPFSIKTAKLQSLPRLISTFVYSSSHDTNVMSHQAIPLPWLLLPDLKQHQNWGRAFLSTPLRSGGEGAHGWEQGALPRGSCTSSRAGNQTPSH